MWSVTIHGRRLVMLSRLSYNQVYYHIMHLVAFKSSAMYMKCPEGVFITLLAHQNVMLDRHITGDRKKSKQKKRKKKEMKDNTQARHLYGALMALSIWARHKFVCEKKQRGVGSNRTCLFAEDSDEN